MSGFFVQEKVSPRSGR